MTRITTTIAIVVACALAFIISLGSYRFAESKTIASQGKVHAELLERIGVIEGEKHALELAIAEQNASIEIAKAKADGADAARKVAESHAAMLAQMSQSRIKKLVDSLGSMTGCSDVLRTFWEARQ